jgi:hypothetical protein
MEQKANKTFTLDIEVIKRKVADSIKKPIKNLDDLERFFSIWFCLHYNLPYKSDELKKYTLEELIYEYYDVLFRTSSEELEKFLNGNATDKEQEEKEDEEWLKQHMGKQYLSKEEQEKELKAQKTYNTRLADEIKQMGIPDELMTNFENNGDK